MKRRPLRLVAAGRSWWAASIGGRSYSRVRELDLDTHALAFSAQQVLCTAPLVVAISAVLQRATGRDVSFVISRFFGLRGESARAMAGLFGRSSGRISTTALVFGLVVAIAFTTSVAATQQRAFELIWTLPRVTSVRSYLRQVAWVPALAVFISALLVTGRVGRAMHGSVFGTAMVIVLQGAVVFVFYWWTQYWLLGGRVRWHALLPSAVAVGVLTTIAVRASRLIMNGQISWQVEAYGLVGAVFVLSVWLGIFSAVIFAGILIGALWVERRGAPADAARELLDHPLTTAGLESTAAQQDADRRASPVG